MPVTTNPTTALLPGGVKMLALAYRNPVAVKPLPQILCISSYPPRECGIATYSQDLLRALSDKFSERFSVKVCALETGESIENYPEEVKFKLNTDTPEAFERMAQQINADPEISYVLIQHEFGFFQKAGDAAFLSLLYALNKPITLVFHTVLPEPDAALTRRVRQIVAPCVSIVVMTDAAAAILRTDYGILPQKISVIAHGTHLVPHLDKALLKEKYGLSGRKVLSTFGLLSSGKSIETTLDALPAIIQAHPETMFLIIGKTHPGVLKSEGEKYRQMLQNKVAALELEDHVGFINQYLPLPELLELLQLTDIYLFTSKDPLQAVSGTFSYAMSCGCPIISTPIPHAREVLGTDMGMLIDFQDSARLAQHTIKLLSDELLRKKFISNALHRMAPTVWENSAIAHAILLHRSTEISDKPAPSAWLHFSLPPVKLDHVRAMTTEMGMIQFSVLNHPDLSSGYTLDDNARALIGVLMHYELTHDEDDLPLLRRYLEFIRHCQQPDGSFLNYVDENGHFTPQNRKTNLNDANGRAIWALGYMISKYTFLPSRLIGAAENILEMALPRLAQIHSTRSMAFILKGLYLSNRLYKSDQKNELIVLFANRLVQMFRHESEPDWQWFEPYLTYGNPVLPEAMLCAWLETGNPLYRSIAQQSLDFLLKKTFTEDSIKVISNKLWHHKGAGLGQFGEQAIDVAYTVMALLRFYSSIREPGYAQKMEIAFSWFLGNNHLRQIIYNPCTGGCYDGLEEKTVNLNQGAESTLSYLMARLSIEKYRRME